MTHTLPMFTAGEDLPLFTGQPVPCQPATFTPKTAHRQLDMFKEQETSTMTATLERINTAISPERMRQLLDSGEAFPVVNRTSNGVEIIDNRKLIDRLNNPVKGRGVKYHLGDTRFIVTEQYYQQLTRN